MTERHSCVEYCAGRLRGMAENLKLRGEIPDDFRVQVRPVRLIARVPAGAFVAKCEHGRKFVVIPEGDIDGDAF